MPDFTVVICNELSQFLLQPWLPTSHTTSPRSIPRISITQSRDSMRRSPVLSGGVRKWHEIGAAKFRAREAAGKSGFPAYNLLPRAKELVINADESISPESVTTSCRVVDREVRYSNSGSISPHPRWRLGGWVCEGVWRSFRPSWRLY